MQLIFIFIAYTIICLILTYYFHLFASQNVYTKSEIKDILPQLASIVGRIYSRYTISVLLCLFIMAGISGIFILSVFKSWFFNSALLPLILYFTAPRLAVYFDQIRVTISDNIYDKVERLYSKYYIYIITGFFSGCSTQLIDIWVNKNIINFYWLFFNLIITVILTIIVFNKDIFET